MRYYNNLYNNIKDTLKNPTANNGTTNAAHFGPSREYTTSVSDKADLLFEVEKAQ